MSSTVDGSSAVAVALVEELVTDALGAGSDHRGLLLTGGLRHQIEAALLDDIASFRLFSGIEKDLAPVDVAGLGADRQNAQGLST